MVHSATKKASLFFLLPFLCVSCKGSEKKKESVECSRAQKFFFFCTRRAFGVSTLGFHFFLFFLLLFFLKIFKEKGPHTQKDFFFSLRIHTHHHGGARAESRRRAKFVELYAVTGCVCCCCCCFCSLLLLFPFLKGDENRILDLKTRGCSILKSQRALDDANTISSIVRLCVLLLPFVAPRLVSSKTHYARSLCRYRQSDS